MPKTTTLGAVEGSYHIEALPGAEDEENGEAFVLDRQAPGLRLFTLGGDIKRRDTWDGIAQIIMRDIPILKDTASRLYYYKDGYYHLDYNEQVIKCLVSAFCTHHNKMELAAPLSMQKILGYIANISPPTPLVPTQSVINFSNGMYGVTKGMFVPHSPKFNSLIQIPVAYDPQAKGVAWNDFIEGVVPKDCVEPLWRVIGLLLIPFTRAQKAVILLGTGSNGKGVFLEALQNLIGADNYSVLMLSQINDKFSTQALIGKLANIATEESIGTLEDSAIFKAIVAGEPINIDVKHKQPVRAKIFSRLVLATNELPKTMDTSFGFFRRFSIFRFPRTFALDPAKGKELSESLMDPYECSSAINMALRYLPSTIEVGIQPSPSMIKELDRYVDSEAPEKKYISTALKDKKGSTIPKADIYHGYCEFCKEKGLKPTSEEHFWRHIRSVKRDWSFTRVRIGGEQTYVIMGCDWVENS
jgi:P4 family phage/plasmid primase-like protien